MTTDPTLDDLKDPAFLRYAKLQSFEPDAEDFPPIPRPTSPTRKEMQREYQLARERKLIRMWKVWSAMKREEPLP